MKRVRIDLIPTDSGGHQIVTAYGHVVTVKHGSHVVLAKPDGSRMLVPWTRIHFIEEIA